MDNTLRQKNKSEKALIHYYKNREKLLKIRRERYKEKGRKAKHEYYLKIKDNEDYIKRTKNYSKKKVICPHCKKKYANGYLKSHIKKFHI